MTGFEPCAITPGCGWPRHKPSDHPCGEPIRPGDPCRYCGKPQQVGPDGGVQPCLDCWTPITIADFKAFVAEQGWDTKVTERQAGDQ